MLAKLHTFSLLGIEAIPVDVEVDVSPATLPKTILVGLPEAAVKESTHRVEWAMVNSDSSGRMIAAAGAHNLLMLGPPGSGKREDISQHPTVDPVAILGRKCDVAATGSFFPGILPEMGKMPDSAKAPRRLGVAAAGTAEPKNNLGRRGSTAFVTSFRANDSVVLHSVERGKVKAWQVRTDLSLRTLFRGGANAHKLPVSSP